MVPPVDVSLKIEPLSHCVCCTIRCAQFGRTVGNMSTNSRDTVSVQNEEPSYGGNTSQVVSMYSRPQNTEEGVRVGCPGTVCLFDWLIFCQRQNREKTGKWCSVIGRFVEMNGA